MSGGLKLPNDGNWYESKERSSKGFTKIPGRGRPEMKWYRDSYAVFHPELDRYVCHCEKCIHTCGHAAKAPPSRRWAGACRGRKRAREGGVGPASPSVQGPHGRRRPHTAPRGVED